MPDTRKKPPRDQNQLAKYVVDLATGEIAPPPKKAEAQRKGGLKGGKARANKLSTTERQEIARKAAAVRWGKDETKP